MSAAHGNGDRNRVGLASVCVAALAVSGCTGPDLAPVPTVAGAPYICDGVPREGAELTAGEPLEVSVTGATWGEVDDRFVCTLEGADTLVRVEEMSVTSSPFGPTDERVLASMAASSQGEPLDLGAPGAGYVWGEVSAGWVCDGRTLVVEALGDPVEGRDRAADVTNLLASMLPWACEGQDVPPADEEG